MREFQDDKIDAVSWVCFIGAILLVIGFFAFLVWVGKAEMRSRQEARPQTLADIWRVHNQEKYNL